MWWKWTICIASRFCTGGPHHTGGVGVGRARKGQRADLLLGIAVAMRRPSAWRSASPEPLPLLAYHEHLRNVRGAAGAARLLGLNEEQTISAYGSAEHRPAACGVLDEQCHEQAAAHGQAALNGLLSALLAQRGFTGARKILEGEKGFFRATSSDFDQRNAWLSWKGILFRTQFVKYHASCGHTHSTIDAVLQATQEVAHRPDEIDSVSVSLYQERWTY